MISPVGQESWNCSPHDISQTYRNWRVSGVRGFDYRGTSEIDREWQRLALHKSAVRLQRLRWSIFGIEGAFKYLLTSISGHSTTESIALLSNSMDCQDQLLNACLEGSSDA